jgi:hypothetical protein
MTRSGIIDERTEMRRFELQWSRTWTDRSHDFSAYDGELLVGRVYRILGGPADRQWRWSLMALVGNRRATDSGVADDRDSACMAMERAYRLFRQSIAEAP